jgi:metal-responsive CopG/Arc/MetJ family transcriptional regulator
MYDQGMKTTISIADRLFDAAEALARRLRVRRSRLYATAIAEYVAKHQTAKVTERLNTVYGSQPSHLDNALRSAQRRTLDRSEW